MELDERVLYIRPRLRRVHSFLEHRLYRHIEDCLDSFVVPSAMLFSDFLVALHLERRILLAPDLTIVLRGNPVTITDRMIEGTPDIVVEVLSSNRRRDLVRKRQLYAAAGVPEYWIFDPVNDDVALLELRDGEYSQRARLTAADALTTPLLLGLSIPLVDVFRHRLRPA